LFKFNNILSDFRRKRNRALIPIFRRNRKDLHGNPISLPITIGKPKSKEKLDYSLLKPHFLDFYRCLPLGKTIVSIRNEPDIFDAFSFRWPFSFAFPAHLPLFHCSNLADTFGCACPDPALALQASSNWYSTHETWGVSEVPFPLS